MEEIPDGFVDMILADHPYGTTQNKWDSVLSLDELWGIYERICFGAIILTASQPFTSSLVVRKRDWFRYAWVWEENLATGHLNAHRIAATERGIDYVKTDAINRKLEPLITQVEKLVTDEFGAVYSA